METRIKTIISNQCGIPLEELSKEADLKRDLNITDLEITDLFLCFEKEFKIKIPSDVIQNVKTVGDIVIYLLDRLDEFSE